MIFTKSDLLPLARTLFGEASSEGDAARIGVMSSVFNRAKAGDFPGGNVVAGVCTAHRQYDCWDLGSADYARMMGAKSDDPAWIACLGLAWYALNAPLPDNTGGAVFYHDISLKGPPAAWGVVHLTAQHGRLKFYAKGTH